MLFNIDDTLIIGYNCFVTLVMEQYSRGWRGAPAKGVGRVTGARVQISPAPPYSN